MQSEQSPSIVLTDPKPLPKDTNCPKCRAGKDRRVPSGGYGELHDVCGKCGHDFGEWTLGDRN